MQLYLEPFREVKCPHYFSNCSAVCAHCGEDFGCPKCHESDHPFILAGLKCSLCGFVERGYNESCANCKQIFGEYACPECCIFDSIGRDMRPSFHCTKCGKCKVGVDLQHCDICETCRPSPHICLRLQEIECPLCTEVLSEGSMVTLRCGHMIHKACKDKMLSNNKFTCPQCRKLMLSGRQQILYNNKMADLYENEPVSQRLLERYYWFKCNECGGEFVEIHHPVGVRCSNYQCLSFNTSIQQICEEAENPRYIQQIESEVLLEYGVQILQNHVNDIKYYEELFPKLFKRFLGRMIEEDTEGKDMPDDEAFHMILSYFGIVNLDEDDIVDYLEIIELNYVHGMTLEKARLLLIEYVKQTEQR